MQKITPNIWFNRNAKEAVDFYVSVFKDGKIVSQVNYPNEGLADFQKEFAGQPVAIEFELMGYRLGAINAGSEFVPNPSISFMVNFDLARDGEAEKHLKELWEKLSAEGKVLMPLQAYDFSKLYGWIQDKYNVSWQLILTDPKGDPRPNIIPSLLFVTDKGEAAEEATVFYMSVFKNARRGQMHRYPAGMEQTKKVQLCLVISHLKINGLRRWTVVPKTILLNLMKQFHFLFLAKIKQKLITTTISYRMFQKVRFVVGARTNMAFRGKLLLKTRQNCFKNLVPGKI